MAHNVLLVGNLVIWAIAILVAVLYAIGFFATSISDYYLFVSPEYREVNGLISHIWRDIKSEVHLLCS